MKQPKYRWIAIDSFSLDYLKECRILITGGTGALGKKLTEWMLKNSGVATWKER